MVAEKQSDCPSVLLPSIRNWKSTLLRLRVIHRCSTGLMRMINGRSVLVLVDTGANVVAISSVQAEAIGIDYIGGWNADPGGNCRRHHECPLGDAAVRQRWRTAGTEYPRSRGGRWVSRHYVIGNELSAACQNAGIQGHFVSV